MTIYITESQLRNLIAEDEVVFGEFKDGVMEFIDSILTDPMSSSFPRLFTDNKITRDELLDALRGNGIIEVSETFDEPDMSNGKQSMHKKTYTLKTGKFDTESGGGFRDKLYSIYEKMFPDGYRKL